MGNFPNKNLYINKLFNFSMIFEKSRKDSKMRYDNDINFTLDGNELLTNCSFQLCYNE